MDQPVTEGRVEDTAGGGGGAPRSGGGRGWGPDREGEAPASTESPWLADSASPLLAGENGVRLENPARPDRLAWNAFRTLALWDADAWVPRLLEVAIGTGNLLSALEWGGAAVTPWGAGLTFDDLCDVVLDGPEALVVVACTLLPHPTEEHVRAAAMAAVDGSLHGARESGLIVVAPPGSEDLPAELERAGQLELHEQHTLGELLADRVGWVSWPELGRLALDLAEENDRGPEEQVRRLVTELQTRFSDPNL